MDRTLWVYGLVALTLLALGHVLRAYKFGSFLGPVKTSKTRTQFQALLIGYLFNTILPLRLGELIRANVIGKSLRVSGSLSFALIVFERSIDGIILGLIGIVVLSAAPLDPSAKDTLVKFSIALFLVGILLLGLIYLLYAENKMVLKLWKQITDLLNETLKNSARFKVWSIIYGLQRLMKARSVGLYVFQSVLMWGFYVSAVVVLAAFFYTGIDRQLVASLTSYFSVAIPSGPAYLGSYQATANPVLQSLSSSDKSTLFLVASWLLITVPTSLAGAVLLITHRTRYAKISQATELSSMKDKLARDEDITQDMSSFLDAYFSSNTLSHILHKLEAYEDIKLIQYFKGGSNALTLLVYQDGEYKVKKITPVQYIDRLEAQYNWLKQHEKLEHIVTVVGERKHDDFYYIDIEYHPEYVPFFDYIHSQDISKSKEMLEQVFRYLFDNVYHLKAKAKHEDDLEDYISNKINNKLEQASKLNYELNAIRQYDTLIINGVEYDNIHRIMEKVRSNKRIWNDIITFRKSSIIHGDVQVENILATPARNTFKIIDPVDQNEVMSPVIDFGRMLQSLAYGYEFLNRDESRVRPNGNEISYQDNVSAAYHQLYEHFLSVAKELLEPEEYRAILFHTAVHYSRMSTHRVEINPGNVAKYYAVSVRAFNDFIGQYEKVDEK